MLVELHFHVFLSSVWRKTPPSLEGRSSSLEKMFQIYETILNEIELLVCEGDGQHDDDFLI